MMKKYIAPIAERVEMQLEETVMITVSEFVGDGNQLSNFEEPDLDWEEPELDLNI